MLGWLMDYYFKRIWKTTVAAWSRYYPGICLEGLRKNTKNLSQDVDAQIDIETEYFQLQI